MILRCCNSRRIQTPSFWKKSIYCWTAAVATSTISTTAFVCHPSTRSFSTKQQPRHNIHRSSSVHLTSETIEKETLSWVKRVVIGWNLCPFADFPLKNNLLSIKVVRGDDDAAVLAAITAELFSRADSPGTTLVVAPECHPNDFISYLDVVADAEELLESDDTMDLQIAPFHPLFEFADSKGISTYTNRSPYPMFHLLREVEVAKAVDKLNGDASIVWQRNIDLLEDLEKTLDDGEKGVVALVTGNRTEEQETVLQQVLKRHGPNKIPPGGATDP